ncbi:short chain dehydrogenase reductase family protein, putative [Ichthyophthirius multifiliis]|uniref:Short chain dehydrogenase reductase family protein, putative n=1 Tax=Ichthyophthirius multifiliis TaxID=5932 RepID=G0QL08_ICHMU|nr:short chain dehydrogenase reductase family protein, putative [Ichthyophthirius multifiliis]EGR34095.1 short chain dehydrogenase reductase family protein, putative [Ichthyophthirius multifiliis]|eukprot:XP_004039399.1 short chain dehydrogenase reductase family protein, putative [Ichthyophthirius multifiliis]
MEIQKVVITGGNRGLGYNLARYLCKQTYHKLLIILTARNKQKGRNVVIQLKQEFPYCNIIYQYLDVSDKTTIRNFVDWLEIKIGKVDFLINNAGIHEGFGVKADHLQAYEIFNTNLFGLIGLTEQMLQCLSSKGKIICVSSRLGLTIQHDTQIESILSNPKLNQKKIIELAEEYINKLKENQLQYWNQSPFAASKSLVNAYIRHDVSKKLEEQQMAFSVCPGWCQTETGGSKAPFSCEQGIESIIYLMFEVEYQSHILFNGKFVADKKIINY